MSWCLCFSVIVCVCVHVLWPKYVCCKIYFEFVKLLCGQFNETSVSLQFHMPFSFAFILFFSNWNFLTTCLNIPYLHVCMFVFYIQLYYDFFSCHKILYVFIKKIQVFYSWIRFLFLTEVRILTLNFDFPFHSK